MQTAIMRAATTLLAFTTLLAIGVSPAFAAEGGNSSPASPGEDAQVIEQEVIISPGAAATPSGDVGTQAICVAINRVDYPHISSTSTNRAVQAHGNWDRGTCNASLADVTTQIDRRNPIGLFQAVGTQGRARLAPNPNGLTSGGAGRVTAHYPCNGLAAAPFRAWTSIDVVGIADTQNPTYSPATNPITCG